MRTIAVVAVLAALAIIALGRTRGFDPGPDVTVEVLTTESAVVDLDFSPSESEIAEGVRRELEAAAATAGDEVVAAELEILAADAIYIDDLAASAAGDLSSRAAALAVGNYSVIGEDDQVTVISINIELLPRGVSDGINRDHEAGHTIINDGIAVRCAAVIVRDRVDEGATGDRLVTSIRTGLFAAGDVAHERYHLAVAPDTFGSHEPAARRVVDEIVAEGCVI